MRYLFKCLGLLGFSILSFYYTDQIALYVKTKNPIYESLNNMKKEKYVSSINGTIIDNDYIIPGLNGKELNIEKSFKRMHNEYNEELLVYNQLKPTISLENNKNKIIVRGNSKKNSVSIIFDKESSLSQYMIDNNYKVNLLINQINSKEKYELINNANTKKSYNSIETYLNNHKINKSLCLISNSPKDYCKDKYLFKTSLTINHSNISSNLNKISSGEIILVEHTLNINELQLLIDQIKYQNLKIVYLSTLISEIKE